MTERIIESDAADKTPVAPAQQLRPRIALAHDWICGYRGGESVLEAIAAIVVQHFEPARLYLMFDDGRPISPAVDRLRARGLIRCWKPGASPRGLRMRRWMLPQYPAAVASLSLALAEDHAAQPIDLLISSSSAAIKGLRAPPGVPHLSYCHSPARYIWSQSAEYAGASAKSLLRGLALRLYSPRFKQWDRKTAANVTHFLANSRHTAGEIARCYRRESTVIHPPVRTGFFTPDPAALREPFWLIAGAIEPYKRTDLAIAAAQLAGVDLVIAGDGSQRRELERTAPKHARFLGRVSDEELRRLYRTASLFLFPQIEDFGITAVEAQSCGCPVLARRAGGALDSVIDGKTGAFFDQPTPAAIAEAARHLPRNCAEACRANAERFSEAAFAAAMLEQIDSVLPAALRSARTRSSAS